MTEKFRQEWLDIPFTRQELLQQHPSGTSMADLKKKYSPPPLRGLLPKNPAEELRSEVANDECAAALDAVFGKARELTLRILQTRGYIFPPGRHFLENDMVKGAMESSIMSAIVEKMLGPHSDAVAYRDLSQQLSDWMDGMPENLPEGS